MSQQHANIDNFCGLCWGSKGGGKKRAHITMRPFFVLRKDIVKFF